MYDIAKFNFFDLPHLFFCYIKYAYLPGTGDTMITLFIDSSYSDPWSYN